MDIHIIGRRLIFTLPTEMQKFLIVICCWHQGLSYQGTVMPRFVNFLALCEWLLFVSHHSMIISGTSYVPQWINFTSKNRYVLKLK